MYVCVCMYVCGPRAFMICHKKAGGGAGGGRSASPAANKPEEAWPSAYHLVSILHVCIMCVCIYLSIYLCMYVCMYVCVCLWATCMHDMT